MSFSRVLLDVFRERSNQDEKWGQQNHIDGTGSSEFFMNGHQMSGMAEYAKTRCQTASPDTWEKILSEEIFEAYEETDPVRLREELVQSAAVLFAWIECIDRREA